MKLLSALSGFLIALAVLVFAVSNRQDVTVSLWPFDAEVQMPVYLVVLGALAAGTLAGGMFVWAGALRHRFRVRRLNKDVALLSDKLVELERELARHRAATPKEATPLLSGTKWRFWDKH